MTTHHDIRRTYLRAKRGVIAAQAVRLRENWYFQSLIGSSILVTNADSGVTVALNYYLFPYCSYSGPSGNSGCVPQENVHRLLTISGGNIVSDSSLNFSDPWTDFTPLLQGQDGTFFANRWSGWDEYIDAFDQNGNVKWSVPGFYPQMATADGGLIAQSGDGQCVTFDQNGVATGMLADLPQLSWKGAYRLGSVESVVPPPIVMAASFLAVPEGNLTTNGTAAVQHTIGLAWCGTGFSQTGTCQQAPYNVNGADMSFAYVANPDASNIGNAPDFSEAHPDWVGAIQASAMKALKQAFAQFPVIVETVSSHTAFWGCGTPGSCVEPDQDHIVYVVGGWPFQGRTGELLNLHASFVYYWPVNQNAQIAAGYAEGQGPDCGESWCDLTPTYPPQTESDVAAFPKLMQAIGTGIGDSAAHELGHQFVTPPLPNMDCGHDTQRQGGPIPCENNNNFVYNFFSGSGFPQESPDSTGAQFKYTGVPSISWGPAEVCALKRNFLNNPNATCN